MSRKEVNPAYLVYAEAEIADASSMTFEQFGMFARLRAIAWREHGLATDRSEIARRLNLTPKVFAKNAAIVLEPFREVGGRLVLPDQEERRAEQLEKREKARASANTRWHKPDANALRTDSRPDANALRTQSHVVAVAAAGVDADTSKSESDKALPRRFFEERALNSPQYERLMKKVQQPADWKTAIRNMILGQDSELEQPPTHEQLREAICEFVNNGCAERHPQLKVLRGYVRSKVTKEPLLGIM